MSLPEAEERLDGARSSFNVRGRLFVTLLPRGKRVVLKLAPDAREVLEKVQPRSFTTSREDRGWTRVDLRRVDPWLFQELLVGAWRRLASRRAIARWNAERQP